MCTVLEKKAGHSSEPTLTHQLDHERLQLEDHKVFLDVRGVTPVYFRWLLCWIWSWVLLFAHWNPKEQFFLKIFVGWTWLCIQHLPYKTLCKQLCFVLLLVWKDVGPLWGWRVNNQKYCLNLTGTSDPMQNYAVDRLYVNLMCVKIERGEAH